MIKIIFPQDKISYQAFFMSAVVLLCLAIMCMMFSHMDKQVAKELEKKIKIANETIESKYQVHEERIKALSRNIDTCQERLDKKDKEEMKKKIDTNTTNQKTNARIDSLRDDMQKEILKIKEKKWYR